MSAAPDPRSLVVTATHEQLAVALFGDGFPHGVIEVDGDRVWPCVRCGARGFGDIGTARMLDPWRWRCYRCRFVGTRYMLETMVLESAVALERLDRLVYAK
jgi:hypothetical protein